MQLSLSLSLSKPSREERRREKGFPLSLSPRLLFQGPIGGFRTGRSILERELENRWRISRGLSLSQFPGVPTRLNFYRCRSTPSSYFWLVVDGWRPDRFDRYRVTGLCSREWPRASRFPLPFPYIFPFPTIPFCSSFAALFPRSTMRGVRGIDERRIYWTITNFCCTLRSTIHTTVVVISRKIEREEEMFSKHPIKKSYSAM